MNNHSNWKLLESVWQFRMGWWHIMGDATMIAFSDRGIVHRVDYAETGGDQEAAYKLLYERACHPVPPGETVVDSSHQTRRGPVHRKRRQSVQSAWQTAIVARYV